MQKLLDTLNLFNTTQVTIVSLIGNFIIVIILAYILRWHYIRFGHSLSNRRLFAGIFPILATTTFLVIAVVKSSLALSLGLIGALSIVRFRTPIKEPEELAYLFLAIGIGLGIGADQRGITIVVVLLILIIVGLQRVFINRHPNCNFYLNINIEKQEIDSSLTKKISRMIASQVNIVDLRRMDIGKQYLHMTYYIDCEDENLLIMVIEQLHKEIPQADITFIDQGREISA